MKKILQTPPSVKTALWMLILAITTSFTAFSQTAGDYRSTGTGDWGINGTWETLGADLVTWTVATSVPSSTTPRNVLIRAGHTVNVEASVKYFNNLVIDGTLSSTTPATAPFYIRALGPTITVNSGGTFGSPTSGMSLDVYTPNLTITGSGTVHFARIRAAAVSATLTSVALTINTNLQLNFIGTSGTGGVAMYSNGLNPFTVTVNAGKTLTTVATASIAPSSSSSSEPAAGTAAVDFTLNVNGTVNIGDPNGASATTFSLRAGSGKTATLNISSTGILNINGNLLAPGSGASVPALGTTNVNVNQGGQLNFTGGATSFGNCDISSAITTIAGTVDIGSCSKGVSSASNGRSLGTATITSTGRIKLKDNGATPAPFVAGTSVGSGSTTLNDGSTVEYYGSAAYSLPATTWTTYSNLVINNADRISLGASTTVNNSLSFTQGHIYTGAFDLILLSSASILGASMTSHVVTNSSSGSLKRLAPGSGFFPVGPGASPSTMYNPITIANGGNNDFSVYVGNNAPITLPQPNYAINRSFTINSTAPSAGITLTYADTSVVSLSCIPTAPMTLARFDGASWTASGIATPTSVGGTNGVNLQVAYSGISAFGQFAIGNATIIPVELMSFDAKANKTANLLVWATASERDNQQFIIERSANGQTYKAIGSVKGNGTTNSIRDYSMNDETPLSISYYRLRQVDFNGKETVSKTVVVSRMDGKTGLQKIYPSVTSDVLTIESIANGATTVSITDALGRVILTKKTRVTEGINMENITVSHLPMGIYNVILSTANGQSVGKFVKQ